MTEIPPSETSLDLLGVGQAEIGSLGLRERGKLERLNRIIAAAREQFTREGYEGSTIRRIASKARVAVGTVFRYAASKEELLVLTFAGPVAATVREALATMDEWTDPVDQVTHLFGRILDHHAAHPSLSRVLVRELTFLPPEKAKLRARATGRFERLFSRGVEEWQARGLVRSDADPTVVTRCIFALNLAQTVAFLSGEVESVAEAKAQLRASLELFFDGLRTEATQEA